MFIINAECNPIHESPIDLLALSVCWKRLRESEKTHNVGKLLDNELHQYVTDSDIECSTEIKDYYSKKLMILAIKSDVSLSPFRKDLNMFVHSDGLSFRKEMVSLAYKLPELYEYDIKLESIITASKQDFVLEDNEYKFLGKLYRSTRPFKKFEYWFVNNNQNLHCVSIDTQNNLLGFWDNQLENNSTGVIKLLGKKNKRVKDELVYFENTP